PDASSEPASSGPGSPRRRRGGVPAPPARRASLERQRLGLDSGVWGDGAAGEGSAGARGTTPERRRTDPGAGGEEPGRARPHGREAELPLAPRSGEARLQPGGEVPDLGDRQATRRAGGPVDRRPR